MEQEKLNDLILNLLFASVIIFIILLPRFCFRVSDEDYEKYKKKFEKQKMQQQFEELMKQGPPKFEEFEYEDKQEKFKKNDGPQDKQNLNKDLQLNQTKTLQKEDKNEQNKQKLKKDLKKYLSGYKSDLLNQQLNSENSFEEQKSNRKEENQNLLSKKNR